MPLYYTGTGDKGDTGLFGGSRVSKASARIEAIGAVDELQAWIGVARSEIKDATANALLHSAQEDLFSIGADLANPEGKRTMAEMTKNLERHIDEIAKGLTPLRRFIFPSGSRGSALLHACRAVCRRAERRVVAMQQSGHINENVKAYLNRLSSLLFVLARHVNNAEKGNEEEWSSS